MKPHEKMTTEQYKRLASILSLLAIIWIVFLVARGEIVMAFSVFFAAILGGAIAEAKMVAKALNQIDGLTEKGDIEVRITSNASPEETRRYFDKFGADIASEAGKRGLKH